MSLGCVFPAFPSTDVADEAILRAVEEMARTELLISHCLSEVADVVVEWASVQRQSAAA